ncbi:unnamed protein product, partial [Porites evermanni]
RPLNSRYVEDFPDALRTKRELIIMLSNLLWLLSVKHSAVNFPVTGYGAFTPLMPTKVYNDTQVPPGEFGVFNLPNGNVSSMQFQVAVNVGTLHYDMLFDYYSQLSDPNDSKIVEKYYNFYKKDISRKLKRRNWMR